ncbi:MAG: hypothetical protein PVJ27_00835, partial [Candidatus Brocadiaceae bacterium]
MVSGEVNVVWLQGGGCTGCSVSFLNTARPTVRNLLVEQFLPGTHISLRYHPTLMAGQGDGAFELLDGLPDAGYVLAVEGALPENESFCTVGTEDGREVSVTEKFVSLADRASLVLAVGTCSSFGGIPAGNPNPGAYRSASDVMCVRAIATP